MPRALHIVWMIGCLAGCGGGSTPADAGSLEIDGGADFDAGKPDAGVGVDAGRDAGAEIDAGASLCPPPIEDRNPGQCDERGRIGCEMWAQEHGGSGASTVCLSNVRCARADACDGDNCTCGAGPECEDDQMCVNGIAGYSCVCIMDAP